MRFARCVAVVCLLIQCLVFPASASAQVGGSLAEFFAGRTITIIVGSTAGGGYDFAARAVSRSLGRHLPGKPNVVVQNMPGAGSIAASNHIYNIAPQDGTVIGAVQRPIPFEPLFEEKGVRFDVRRFNYIGSTTSEIGVIVAWHTAPQHKIADVLAGEMIVGGNGPATDTELFPRALNRLVGTRFRIVGGYPGETQILLAMERGEVHGVANWTWSNIVNMHPHWLVDRKIRLLLQLGPQKHPDIPADVPLIVDLGKTERQRLILTTLMEMKMMGRPFLLGPGVPPERVAAIRAAFRATMSDPEYVAEIKKARGTIDPVFGEDMQARLAKVHGQPAEFLNEVRAAVAH